MTLTPRETALVTSANASGRVPVVLVHGLWLHWSSWEPWVDHLGAAGYAALAPGWPGEGETVEETRQDPSRLARVGVEQVTDHFRQVIAGLERKPVVVGHSFGGLVAQKLLGEGLAESAVALDPAQMRGVTTLPLVQLWNALPVLSRPTQYTGTSSQTRARFAKAFCSAVTRAEADELHDRWTVPAPGRPLFESATANLLRRTAASVRTDAERGPLLIVGGGQDRVVPAATTRAIAQRYAANPSLTEYQELADRGHSLVVDSGWKDLADRVLEWLTGVGQGPRGA